jgi:uncharacterized protein YggE
MKKIWWLIPCLIVVVAFSASGCEYLDMASTGENSQQTISIPPQQNTGIWVTGQGEVMAVPDIASLRLGVEAQADTVAEAQAGASEAMNKVMEALKDNGVAKEDIQTQQFGIYPLTKWDERKNEGIIIGYRVSNIVLAKIREVDRVGEIIEAVAKAGGDLTRIQDITFTVDDPTEYYQEARAKAMEDAKDKATQLADSAGVELGKPTYISEGPVYWPEVTRGFEEAGAVPIPGPETPISPGELKITVSIQVVYAIA